MKLKFKQLAITLVLTIAAFINPKQIFAQQEEVGFQLFYDALSPYGQWVENHNYGYVWIPDVGSDFAPYSTNGYWIFTDYGWTWVSDYEWGWAPFHYGRWDYDDYLGWFWVPDNEWGPSWVNWRSADGYYGWSPMEPGISISLSFNRPFNRYNDHWIFVRDRDFERHDIYRYSVDRSDHAMIIRNSTVINKTYIDNNRHTTYVAGPARDDVQRVTGRRIDKAAIQDYNKPGMDLNNGQLRLYRPLVMKNRASDHKPAPGRIEKIENVKRPSERNVSSKPQNIIQKNNKDVQPTQQRPQQAAPASNNQRQQQQNMNRTQATQPTQHATPVDNNQRQQQQNNTRQQNMNRSQPAQQPQQTTPATNNQRQQQQNNIRQQNMNRPQPAQQPQQTTPATNNQRQQQQNNTRQQNMNRSQPAQQTQQAAPARNNVRPQPNTVKPQNQKSQENSSDESKK